MKYNENRARRKSNYAELVLYPSRIYTVKDDFALSLSVAFVDLHYVRFNLLFTLNRQMVNFRYCVNVIGEGWILDIYGNGR